MNDPKTAIDAVLQTEEEHDGVKIFPMTLARYALLELVDSPFLNPEVKLTASTLMPSIFVMSQEKDVLKKYNSKNVEKLLEDASEWCEGVQISDVTGFVQKIMEKIDDMMKVIPSSTEDAKKKDS